MNFLRRIILPPFLSLITAMIPFTAPTAVAEPEPSIITDASYVLKANDAVRLSVYEEPELSVSVRILATGEASFPLIGSVKLAGLSVEEAAREITQLYAADYLVEPRVTLTVDNYAVQYVSIIGSVTSPGQIAIPVSGNLDLAAVMASAGGLSPDADPNSIQLVRANGGTSTFSFNAIRGQAGKTPVNAGDRVIVNQSRFVGQTFSVTGQTGRNGPIPYPLDGKLDIVGAIALAGGLTPLANPRKVTISRRGGEIITLDYREYARSSDKSFPILPGDVVNVPERFW